MFACAPYIWDGTILLISKYQCLKKSNGNNGIAPVNQRQDTCKKGLNKNFTKLGH